MNTKIAVGCLIQWYEIEIVDEYLNSLKSAIEMYKNDKNIILDFEVYIGTMLEKPTESFTTEELGQKILSKIDNLQNRFPDVTINKTLRKNLTTIADYRRDFNNLYSTIADVLVWGETDMLAPKELFYCIDNLNNHPKTPSKYIATFAITKMWDNSWRVLEHPDVKYLPFIENDLKNWWSVRYTMSLEELHTFNDCVDSIDINNIDNLKFNGCGLIISSELIKAGANIPNSVFFVHEDTAFMNVCKKMFPNLTQYHFSNILIAHNRKHPKKRSYIRGEENIDKTDTGALRSVHPWYKIANSMCEENSNNIFDIYYKSKTWEDVFKLIQH